MKIIHQNKIDLKEHCELVRKYVAEHRAGLNAVHGLKWGIARLKLEVAAWKHANRVLDRHDHDLRNLYSSLR